MTFSLDARCSQSCVSPSLPRRRSAPTASVVHLLSLIAVAGGLVGGVTGHLNAAEPESWPSWRGPNRDGVSNETGLQSAWRSGGPRLLWKVESLGKGYSSVAIADGKIITMGQIEGRQSGTYAIALNQRNGRTLWGTKVGEGKPNTTPTIDGNRVYVLDRNGVLTCLTTARGRILWQKDFARDFGGKMMSQWGYSESPLIDGELLICTPGSRRAAMAALNKMTGEVVWTTPVADLGDRGQDGAGYSSIVISNGGGVKQYVQLMGRGVISVNASDGKLLWNYNNVANSTANIPTPIIKDDYVFCSTGYQTGAALLKIRPGARSVEEVYYLNSRTLQNHHGGMVLIGDYLYCGHGHNQGFPICIEFETGKVVWGPERGEGEGSAAIVYADDHLYFRYQDGIIALIEATPQGYQLKSSFKMASSLDQSWPHPVIVDGRLYLRDQRALLCYDVRK